MKQATLIDMAISIMFLSASALVVVIAIDIIKNGLPCGS